MAKSRTRTAQSPGRFCRSALERRRTVPEQIEKGRQRSVVPPNTYGMNCGQTDTFIFVFEGQPHCFDRIIAEWTCGRAAPHERELARSADKLRGGE